MVSESEREAVVPQGIVKGRTKTKRTLRGEALMSQIETSGTIRRRRLPSFAP